MPVQDRNEPIYDVVAAIKEIDNQQIDAYWRRVVETLQHVFGMSRSDAEDKVRELWAKLKETGPDTQLHFYHSDPFEVAADLAGAAARPITPEEKRRYIELQNLPKDDRPDPAALDRLLPEDLHSRS
jgi:hypothetical protein